MFQYTYFYLQAGMSIKDNDTCMLFSREHLWHTLWLYYISNNCHQTGKEEGVSKKQWLLYEFVIRASCGWPRRALRWEHVPGRSAPGRGSETWWTILPEHTANDQIGFLSKHQSYAQKRQKPASPQWYYIPFECCASFQKFWPSEIYF